MGSIIGAITGAILGLATESGCICGAGIGAISGAVFSMDVVESCLVIWRSRGSGIWSILFVVRPPSLLFSPLNQRHDRHNDSFFRLAGHSLKFPIVLLSQIDIIASLLSGRLVREEVGPAVQSAVQSQVYIFAATA